MKVCHLKRPPILLFFSVALEMMSGLKGIDSAYLPLTSRSFGEEV
jgi:hypothetical protein